MFLAWNWLFFVVVCCFLVFFEVFGVLGVSVGVEGFVAGVFAAYCGCSGVDAVCRCDACASFRGCHGG